VVYGPHPKTCHPAELSAAERDRVLEVINRLEYADYCVTQIWAAELDEGRYYCSQRTMYRILADHGQSGERRRQATHPPRVIPELVAISVNEVWSWDITKMKGPSKGIWYHAYVIIDIFSRYIVGWRVETKEDGRLAADLVREIVDEQAHPPTHLHADGGAAMTSKALASLLVDLDVIRTHNRPHTSNDNPYSEAQFKTMKYVPDYPDHCESVGHARTWTEEFVSWYNHEHYHSGIGLMTPASVHYGLAGDIYDQRQRVLDGAYAAHPERFTQRPRPPKLPVRAAINDPCRKPAEPTA
jgi:transposase InsO family protein